MFILEREDPTAFLKNLDGGPSVLTQLESAFRYKANKKTKSKKLNVPKCHTKPYWIPKVNTFLALRKK